VLQEINKLTNFACYDGEGGIIANAIINFDLEDGRRLIEYFIKDQIDNYNSTLWGFNGPLVFSRVLTRMCQTNETLKMVEKFNCDGFHILPRETCYPIWPAHHARIFNESFTAELMDGVKHAITVHMWNGLTKKQIANIHVNSTYTVLAKKFCPRVFATVDDNF
jgi:hypothetical protein